MRTVSTTAIAAALEVSPQTIANRAERERWRYRDTPSGRVWDLSRLPRDLQLKIIAAPDAALAPPPARGDAALFKEAGERSREKAVLRSALLTAYRSSGLSVEDFIGDYNARAVQPAVYARLGSVSVPTFYRWLRNWKTDGVDGVIPRWGFAPKAGCSLSDMEKGYLEYWYLTPERRSAAHCWKLLRWNIADSRASYQASLRYLNALPRPLVDFYRLGKTKFDSLYQPYIERDPTMIAPMDQVVSDHHCFDFVVTRNGTLFRPWITVFQDFRSSKILGWCPSVYPSSISIAVALYRMTLEFGAARMFHMDNGKDYRSKVLNGRTGKVKVVNQEGIGEETVVHIQGAFGILGADVTFSRPYHGQSKGRTERTFGTFAEYFSKNTGTYVGSNTVTRPEDAALFYRALNKKAKRLDVYAWDDYVVGLESFIRWWNAHWRGEGKGMDGMTPDEVFAAFSGPARPVDPEALLLALSKAEIRKVKENGVSVGGVQYWAPELFEYSGREVVVRLPIANPDKVLVTDAKGKVLCTAVADWFAETGRLSDDNERVGAARKVNREQIDRFGVGRIEPPRGGRNFVEIAAREFPVAEERPLLAAGAEHDMAPPARPRLISPLDL